MPITIPSIGEKFPEIEVHTDFGTIKLPDYFVERGKWFILFSHPADFTPVCTTEFVAFSKRYQDFQKLGVELIGLSVDNTYSHIKWKEWIKEKLGVEVPFPIIADPLGRVASKLGLIHAESGVVTVRAVFIVDDKGVVRAILYYPTETGRNIDELLRLVEALKLSDKYGRAMPAGWPNNELIGDNLIVPPADTVKDAEERTKQYKCFDWWFCYDDKATQEEKEQARGFLRRAANC